MFKLQSLLESDLSLDSGKHLERQFIRVGLLLFLIFTAICYWSIPSLAYQEWDSIVYAAYVENKPLPMDWGNHPLVHHIQSIVYRIASSLGYQGRALTLLQILNTLATAASVTVFYFILVRRMSFSIIQAAGWAAFFGSAYSIISFAGTGDVYSISLLLLLIAWNSMLLAYARPDSTHLIIAGVLIGVAGMAHQFNAILLGASVCVGLFYHSPKAIAVLAGVMLSTLVLGYGFLGYLSTNSLAYDVLVDWGKGYVGDPSYGRFFSSEGLRLAIDSGSQSLIRASADSGLGPLRMLLFGIVGFVLMSLPFQRRLRSSEYIQIGLYCVFPALVGLLLIIWWEPMLEGKWWILFAPFPMALLAFGIPNNKWLKLFPASLAISILFVNQLNGLRHEYKPDLVFEKSLQTWIDNTSHEDVLYESTKYTEYLLFWADRPHTISVSLLFYGVDTNNPYRPLREAIQGAWDRGASVFYSEGLNSYYTDDRLAVVGASIKGLESFFGSYRREGPVFEYQETANGPMKQVFRLVPSTQ